MLNCIWTKQGVMSVVETDEFERLMATGDYFDNPWNDKYKKQEIKHERTQRKSQQSRRAGHNLQSKKPRDDIEETDSSSDVRGLRRGDDEHGGEGTGICSEINEGDWPRVSGKVTDNLNVSSTEDHK
jgi:hypothetical protein